jgi:hypothetical protein
MKAIFVFTALLFASSVFSQTPLDIEILNLSKKIFRLEVDGKMDSLANLFDDRLMIVSSSGVKKNKQEYLSDLKMGKPVHNSIQVKEAVVNLFGNTAVVVGKGVFVVAINAIEATFNLSYMEVFAKDDKSWKLVALHASRLSN